MGGPLNAEQQNAFNQLKEHLPVDLVPGYSVATTGETDPESPWIKKMARFSKDLGVNAYAYFNYNARAKGGIKRMRRRPKKIISSEGFPPWVTVTYAYPPPFAFKTLNKERDIKHFVIHSFGHAWHATSRDGKRIGWMNSSRAGRGVVAIERDGETIYIAKGSDPETMAHFTRFSAGLRACLNSAAKATAHFFIDTAGNLVVIGDCNDIMFTSNGLNISSCGVEMEEAFYVTKDTKGKGNKALWRPGGRPPGTAGNVEYFAYSPQQMLTLSILVKKLETAYPQLRERNVSFDRRKFTKDDAGGYTIHDFIKGSTHLDISPHFLSQDLWDAFFKLTDTHTHINPTNIFRPRTKYDDSGESQIVEPVSTQVLTSMTERLYNYAKDTGVAMNRSASIAKATKQTINDSAGTNATRESKRVSQQVATTVRVAQQTQNPIRELPASDLAIGDDGLQVGSDDMWESQ